MPQFEKFGLIFNAHEKARAFTLAALNPVRQQTLRRIQAHINAVALRHGARLEAHGLTELYHLTPDHNGLKSYATPRKGVALIPGRDVLSALEHVPRLIVIEGIYPPEWYRMLEAAGVVRVSSQALLTYGVIPGCDQDEPVNAVGYRNDGQFTLDADSPIAWVRERSHGQPLSTVIEAAQVQGCDLIFTLVSPETDLYKLPGFVKLDCLALYQIQKESVNREQPLAQSVF